MKNKKFLEGRYQKIDEIYVFTIKIYLIILLLNIFIKSNILSSLEIILLCITFYRFFSKNITKREKENKTFIKYKTNLLNIFKTTSDNEYIYKKCHHCKKKLKFPIPYKIGIKKSICPKCGKTNTYLILKKTKVELISKK